MEIKEGYKNTEVGVIPSDWEVKTIGDIFTFYSTSNFSKAEMTLDGEVGCVHYGLIHAIDNTSFSLKNGVKYYVKKEQAKYETLQNGDIVMVDASEDLVGLNKSVEVSEICNKEYIAGLHTFHLRDTYETYINFFRGLVLNSNAVKKQMLKVAVGMKVYGVSKPQLKQIIVPIPPKAEQTAIATALSDADALISSLENLIAKKRNIKQGAMQKLLQPKEGWEVKKLGEIFDFKQGVQCEIELQSLTQKSNQLRFIRIVDLTQPNELPRYIDDPGSIHHIKKDDLFMVRYGNPGLLGFGYEGVIANNLFRLIPKFYFSTHFFYYHLGFKNDAIMQLTSSTTMAALSFTALKGLIVSFPKFKEEQTRIATILSDMDAEILAMETKLEKYRKVKLGMMQNLLTGKIRLI